MSSGRLFEILYLLLSQKKLTAQQLATHFEVSVRTIYRDLDALSAAGIPVCTTQGKGGGIFLLDHYVLDRALFSEAEQSLLLTALQSLPSQTGGQSSEALAKLAGLFHRRETDWLRVDLSRWGNGTHDDTKFTQIKEAIFEQRILTFTYLNSDGKSGDRRVLPIRLAFKGQAWYLQAFCLEKNAYRTFRISRIRQLCVLEEHFELPPPPPAIDAEDTSDTGGVAVRLRCCRSLAYRAYDEFDESCIAPREDGSVDIRATLPEDNWLYGYLLSFGTGIEVLSPPHVRRRLAEMAKEILEKYENLS